MPMYPATLTNQQGSRLDTIGLLRADSTLFSDLQLPEGLNKQLCIDTIISEHGRAPLAHPDPGYMRYMIGVWSRRNFITWQKLYDTQLLQYNPLWNNDRYETETNSTQRNTNGTGTLDSTVNGTHNSKEQGTNTAQHTEKENSKTVQNATTTETRTTDKTGDSTSEETGHSETVGNTTSDGTSTTDTTNNQTSKSNTTTDTTTKTTVQEDTEGKSVHDISPENAPDYQPDDTTSTTGSKTTTSDGTENTESETTGTVTDTGNSRTVTHGETNSTETTDTTQHGETHLTENEKMDGERVSNSTTDFGREAGSQDGAEHTIDRGATDKTVTDTDTTSTEAMNEMYTHEFHQWGSIGVITSQQLIQQEREVVQYNVYMTIAEYYHREFCLKFY